MKKRTWVSSDIEYTIFVASLNKVSISAVWGFVAEVILQSAELKHYYRMLQMARFQNDTGGSLQHKQELESGGILKVETSKAGTTIALGKAEKIISATLNRTETIKLITNLEWALMEMGVDTR